MDISDNQSHGCPKRKRESGRKRGELQSGSAATPARPAPFADGRGKFKRRSDRFGKKTCACLGRPARSAGCPGAATGATGHRRRPTCIKTITYFYGHSNMHLLKRSFAGLCIKFYKWAIISTFYLDYSVKMC